MKYLEHIGLEAISSSLNTKEIGGGLALSGRVEIYSTKKTGEDKKQSKIIEQNLLRQRSNSFSGAEKKTRKLLVDLIQTLAITHADFECSDMSAENFDAISTSDAIQRISSALAEVTVREPEFLAQLWREVDEAMDNQLRCTEAFAVRDVSCLYDSEEEVVWALHIFFCHKELRRICYFTCSARTKYRHAQMQRELQVMDSDEENDEDEAAMNCDDDGEVRDEDENSADSDDDELHFWRT